MNTLQHLAHRHFEPARYRGVWVGEGVLTVALWNLSGQMVGYQAYRPDKPKVRGMNSRDQRYFTWVTEGQHGVWGLETFTRGSRLYLCEGVFDACHLHCLGYPAIAVLANNPKPIASWLRSLGVELVAVCDADTAGKKLARFAHHVITLPEGKDPGDMTTSDLAAILLGEVPETTQCPWCGQWGPDYDESERPADYCHHDPATTVNRPNQS